jgi:hypothetical protein
MAALENAQKQWQEIQKRFLFSKSAKLTGRTHNSRSEQTKTRIPTSRKYISPQRGSFHSAWLTIGILELGIRCQNLQSSWTIITGAIVDGGK